MSAIVAPYQPRTPNPIDLRCIGNNGAPHTDPTNAAYDGLSATDRARGLLRVEFADDQNGATHKLYIWNGTAWVEQSSGTTDLNDLTDVTSSVTSGVRSTAFSGNFTANGALSATSFITGMSNLTLGTGTNAAGTINAYGNTGSITLEAVAGAALNMSGNITLENRVECAFLHCKQRTVASANGVVGSGGGMTCEGWATFKSALSVNESGWYIQTRRIQLTGDGSHGATGYFTPGAYQWSPLVDRCSIEYWGAQAQADDIWYTSYTTHARDRPAIWFGPRSFVWGGVTKTITGVYVQDGWGYNWLISGSSGNMPSDDRLKYGEAALTGGLEAVKLLQPRSYKQVLALSDPHTDGEPKFGFVAQEVEVVPGLAPVVSAQQDAKNGNEMIKTVDYNGITAVNTQALKELLAKVEALEARVAALEG